MKTSRKLLAVGAASATNWASNKSQIESLVQGRCFCPDPLQESPVKTFNFQNLPTLPLPTVQHSVSEYLSAVQPLVMPQQFEKTKAIAAQFVKEDGRKLQRVLAALKRGCRGDSYDVEHHYEAMLANRDPVPIRRCSSVIVRNDPNQKDGLVRAAYWIASSCRWLRKLREGTLRPSLRYACGPKSPFRSEFLLEALSYCPYRWRSKLTRSLSLGAVQPLDMSQYLSFVCSYLQPLHASDDLVPPFFLPTIVVLHRGWQFRVNIATPQGEDVLPEEQIYARLKQIVDLNLAPAQFSVGSLTVQGREQWADAYARMKRHPLNQESFDTMCHCPFTVAIDDETDDLCTPAGMERCNEKAFVSPSNRYWDKLFTIIVRRDGALAVNYSWFTFETMQRYIEDVFNDSIVKSTPLVSTPATEPVDQLRWELLSDAKENASAALQQLVKDVKGIDWASVVFDITCLDSVHLVDSNSLLHIAAQLAWWRLCKSMVTVSEEVSRSQFRRGLTETAHPTSQACAAFIIRFDHPSASREEKLKLFSEAVRRHSSIMEATRGGAGFDCHLNAMWRAAQTLGSSRGTVPFFEDETFRTLQTTSLKIIHSTSEAVLSVCSGPCSGYTIGCETGRGLLNIVITSQEGGPPYPSKEYATALYVALSDICKLFA